MNRYNHLFFDLDHTLWDFDTNSRITLEELFDEHELDRRTGVSFSQFLSVYKVINDRLWEAYRKHEITKEELRNSRFFFALKEHGLEDPHLGHALEEAYISRSPKKTTLFPDALEVLGTLSERYRLHIITNGFTEVQDIKMSGSGLAPYFVHRITSEEAGANKPDPRIFLHALRTAGAKRKESLMIGDHLEADIGGARRVGMDQVFFNPHGQAHEERPTYEIRALRELLDFL